MTKQELFDTVTKHLLTQKCKALGDDGSMCRYKTDTGLKCAAGCLIPDDKYDPRLEQATVVAHADDPGMEIGSQHGFDNYKFFKDLVQTEENLLFLYELQKIHDRHLSTEWVEKLQSLARWANLEWKFEDFGLTLDPNSDKV